LERIGCEQYPAAGIKDTKVEPDELLLAMQLINGSTCPSNPSAYNDHHEAVVKKLVIRSERVNLFRKLSPAPKGKVINIVDALRSSLAGKN
jgi:non-homologous end joining protein Ku